MRPPRARNGGNVRPVPWSVRRRVTKQLVCPACGDVIASATYTRWPGNLVLVSPDGERILAVGAGLEVRRAEQQLTRAGPAEPGAARDRLQFLRRHLEELIYDLRCRRGHSTLRTAPQIRRAMTHTQGDWVTVD